MYTVKGTQKARRKPRESQVHRENSWVTSSQAHCFGKRLHKKRRDTYARKYRVLKEKYQAPGAYCILREPVQNESVAQIICKRVDPTAQSMREPISFTDLLQKFCTTSSTHHVYNRTSTNWLNKKTRFLFDARFASFPQKVLQFSRIKYASGKKKSRAYLNMFHLQRRQTSNSNRRTYKIYKSDKSYKLLQIGIVWKMSMSLCPTSPKVTRR